MNVTCSAPALSETPAPSVYIQLTERQLGRLQRALKKYEPSYDPAERMLRVPFASPGYHTTLTGGWVHPTRETLIYAVALLDSGDEDLRQRAAGILDRVLALQDVDPESRTYGLWAWFMDEPLSQMAPPDWNWADFCGTQLLEVILNHRDRLSPVLAERIDAAICHAAQSIRKRNAQPDYTNISIMGTFVTLVTAETYDFPDLKEYALKRLRHFCEYTRHHGGFTEYNSPVYTMVALNELFRLKEYARDAEAKRLASWLYELTWEEIAGHYHARSGQWVGPSCRAYDTFLSASVRGVIARAVGLEFDDAADAELSLDEQRFRHECPEALRSCFLEEDSARSLRKTFVKGTPDLIGTTVLRPEFAIGSINCGDFWNQRRALLAYWGTASAPYCLRLRFLHDGYDFSSALFFSTQDEGRVLAGIGFRTDGGDKHPSLDPVRNATIQANDLRLRFELHGVGEDVQLPVPGKIEDVLGVELGGLGLEILVTYANLGNLGARWEFSRQGTIVSLDVVFYSGPSREFCMRDWASGVVGFALNLGDSVSFSNASASRGDGKVHLAWDGLSLDMLEVPGPAAELQAGFSSGGVAATA